MTFWDYFNKFVGVQGVMGLFMLMAYIGMTVAGRTVPEQFANLMTLIIGYYFAKNGLSVLSAFRGQAPLRRKDDK